MYADVYTSFIGMMISDELDDAGYRVIEANCSDGALALLDARSDIRGLVTDVPMAGQVDGLALAMIAARMQADIDIIAASGHTDENTPLPAEAWFFRKSFDLDALRCAVAEVVISVTAPR